MGGRNMLRIMPLCGSILQAGIVKFSFHNLLDAICFCILINGRFQKKKLMEFSKAGWVGPRCPGFPLKKQTNMVVKHFILPVEHLKHPITHPRDCRDGDTKRVS